MIIQPSVISMLDRTMICALRVSEKAYIRSPRILNLTSSAVPIHIFPQGMSHTAVSPIEKGKAEREALSSFVFHFWKNATYTQAIIHERYIRDHIANVIPEGVTDVENIADISAWVIPQIR